MAEIIFPEKMEPLGDDQERNMRTIDDYIRYMVERIDFAFNNYTTKPNFKNSTEGIITGKVDANYIKTLDLVVGNQIQMGTDAEISWDHVGGKPDNLATKSDIPTKTSQLTNDSSFATTSQIPTEARITQITKNTLETESVTATNLNITGGTINMRTSSDLSDKIELNGALGNEQFYKASMNVTGVNANYSSESGLETNAKLSPSGVDITSSTSGVNNTNYVGPQHMLLSQNNNPYMKVGLEGTSFYSPTSNKTIPITQYKTSYSNAIKDTSGTSGWVHVLSIGFATSATYADAPIEFDVATRYGIVHATLKLSGHQNLADQTIEYFVIDSIRKDIEMYAKKVSTGQYKVYLKKTGSYDDVILTSVRTTKYAAARLNTIATGSDAISTTKPTGGVDAYMIGKWVQLCNTQISANQTLATQLPTFPSWVTEIMFVAFYNTRRQSIVIPIDMMKTNVNEVTNHRDNLVMNFTYVANVNQINTWSNQAGYFAILWR